LGGSRVHGIVDVPRSFTFAPGIAAKTAAEIKELANDVILLW
jgi:hypothetical protein